MQDEMSEGQRTPVSSGSSSSSPHMEMIQQKLNDALKILSPQEKLEQIRRQAKANAESQQKLNRKLFPHQSKILLQIKKIPRIKS